MALNKILKQWQEPPADVVAYLAASGKHSRVYMSRRREFPELLPVDFISFMCLSVGLKSCSKANKAGDWSMTDRGQSKYISNSYLFL